MALYMAFLLCTGVSVNLIAQHLSDLKFADQQAHILPSVKFISTFIFAALIQTKSNAPSTRHAPTQRQRRLMWLIGLLDATAYVCFCYGFTACGATLSSIILSAMGQVFTALATRFILHKRLSSHQILSILLVCLGLVIRYLPSSIFYSLWKEISFLNIRSLPKLILNTIISNNSYMMTTTTNNNNINNNNISNIIYNNDSRQLQGFLFIVTASALYSCLGIAYESLTTDKSTPPPPYPIILWNTSQVGLLGACIYQVFYVLPRWTALVQQPFSTSTASLPTLVILLVIFGAAFNIHMYAQSLVFRHEGALGVALVNAVRGAAVTVIVGVLFCSDAQPLLCLTVQSCVAAGVVTVGGVLWVLAGAVNSRRKSMKKSSGDGDGGEEKKEL